MREDLAKQLNTLKEEYTSQLAVFKERVNKTIDNLKSLRPDIKERIKGFYIIDEMSFESIFPTLAVGIKNKEDYEMFTSENEHFTNFVKKVMEVQAECIREATEIIKYTEAELNQKKESQDGF